MNLCPHGIPVSSGAFNCTTCHSISGDVKHVGTPKDPVDHPTHYNVGTIEVIDAIKDWKLNFARGNVLKYMVRAGRKDESTELQDLRKARWYLDWEIEHMERAEKIK